MEGIMRLVDCLHKSTERGSEPLRQLHVQDVVGDGSMWAPSPSINWNEAKGDNVLVSSHDL